MKQNKKFLLSLFIFSGIVFGFLIVDGAMAESLKIIRACSEGQFIRYTDCETGKAISRRELAPGKHRFGSISADGQSFKVLISGGKNIYKVYVSLSNSQKFYVADYPATANYVNLTAEAKKQGWTSSGIEIFMPKTGIPTIKYPVSELDNCQNENDCKAYCANPENMLACANFGEKTGLISPEDAKKAKEFSDVLKGQGPGRCKTAEECKNYCADISRLNECVGFAEKHNLIPPDQLKEAKQVMKALAQGAVLPGGCRDKDSCKNYCAGPTHVEECLGFAEKAGFVSPAEAEQARKVLPFLTRGETPGKCKTKDECENYCSVESNTMECVNFAEKAGFMTKEEGEIVRKTGGKGPGGCRSKEACETYCNQSENQNACFEFAQKYNLIPEEKLKEIKEGMGRLRAGLAQAPEEAIQCLEEKLGADISQKIEDGSFMPSPQAGELIKGCFMKALPKIKEKMEMGLKYADPETKACLEKGLGLGGLDRMLSDEPPSPESGDVIRNCFESMRESGMKKLREGLGQMPPEMRACAEEKLGKETIAKIERGESVIVGPEIGEVFQKCAGSMTEMMDKMMEQAPPEIRKCIKEKIKDPSNIRGPEDVQPLIQECMKNFIPQGIPKGAEEFMPEGIPKGAEEFMPKGIPGGMTPPGGIPESACANFKLAPSCDYVPESVRDMCKKCRGE